MYGSPEYVAEVKKEMRSELKDVILEINGVHYIEALTDETLLMKNEDGTETYHRK